MNTLNKNAYLNAGMFTTALRWVVGWTYFSAFWRRVVLVNKLDPETAGYIGEKFNHFLPNALGIRPIIEYLVSNPDALWWAMVVFTVVEGIVGLLFILGLFTRLMSIGVFMLATGILLGSGWLGTTCLDEWQIGVLGVAAGFTIFLTGGGRFALDAVLAKKAIGSKKWFQIFNSGTLPLKTGNLKKLVLIGSIGIFSLTLFTNQYFHGGVYGELHNLSVRPHVTITKAQLVNDELSFTVFRDEGADVYGSFLIGVQLLDKEGNILFERNQNELAKMAVSDITNDYVAKVKPGKHSLILPLGARAKLQFKDMDLMNLEGDFTLKLIDISGIEWKVEIK